jgi:hypothetical protein
VSLFGEDPADALALERLKFTNESLRERLEEKDALIDRLMTQIQNLQDALVNREAPEAYNALMRDRADANMTPKDQKELDKQKRELEVTSRYLQEVEKDNLFESVDELNSTFLNLFMDETEPEAIHGEEYRDES